MFIKRLYQHSKILFVAFVAFVLAFVVINYKWGIVATPLLQYGMYSKVVHIKDTQEIYLIKANDKLVNGGDLSFSDRDKLQLFLKQYEIQQQVNEQLYTTMSRYLPGAPAGNYRNEISDTFFTGWYKKMAAAIIKTPVVSLAVYKQHFQWQQTAFKNIDSTSKLACIVP